MSQNNFKMVPSFTHDNNSTEKDSDFVRKSNTNSCLSLENIQFSCYCELLSP